MEAPPDPAALAAAPGPAPLRAPQVARLREEQEKVTGRGRARASAESAGGARGPAPGPARPRGSARPPGREGESDGRNFCHVLLLSFVCGPLTSEGAGPGEGRDPASPPCERGSRCGRKWLPEWILCILALTRSIRVVASRGRARRAGGGPRGRSPAACRLPSGGPWALRRPRAGGEPRVSERGCRGRRPHPTEATQRPCATSAFPLWVPGPSSHPRLRKV